MEGAAMSGRILILAILVMIGGCSSYRDTYQERAAPYSQHYAKFDLKIDWDIKVSDKGTVIDGTVKNVRYFEMNGVEIWVSALGSNGKTLGRSSSFIIPRSLREGETAHFALTLPVRAASDTKLLFTYRYRAHEDDNEGNFWMQSFEVLVPGK